MVFLVSGGLGKVGNLRNETRFRAIIGNIECPQSPRGLRTGLIGYHPLRKRKRKTRKKIEKTKEEKTHLIQFHTIKR
jgi:hypothetical protein